MFKQITQCRVCGNLHLETILDLGNQALTGVFPLPGEKVGTMPVEAVRCSGIYPDVCNLIQLKHTYELSELYGENYGYRSGLNKSMISHLERLVDEILEIKGESLQDGDLIIDIGSNDSTLLQFYNKKINRKLDLVGIDPTGTKFKEFYPDYIRLIPDFFGNEEVTKQLKGKKAKIITSIAMFYDLPDPVEFARQIVSCLDRNGVWILEQAYTPLTISTNDLSVFCQEHIEFYGMMQIKWILDKVGLKVIGVSLNDSNGGSFRVTAAFKGNETGTGMDSLLKHEQQYFNMPNLFNDFRDNIESEKSKLITLLTELKADGKKVIGLGASTKFNVVLQYFGITPELLPQIAEVNSYKFGRTTPGSNIPIITEEEAANLNPDYYLVGPWHFKENILSRFSDFRAKGGKFIFPLPTLEII